MWKYGKVRTVLDTLRTGLWVFFKSLIEWFDVYRALPAIVSVPAAAVLVEDRPVWVFVARADRRALTGLPGPTGNRFLTYRPKRFPWEDNTLPCSRYGRHSLTQ